MAGDNQYITRKIRDILEQDESDFKKIRKLIGLHTSYPDESSKSIIREQTERIFLKFPSIGTSLTTRTDVIERLVNQEPTTNTATNGEVNTQFYQEIGRLCRFFHNDDLKRLLNPINTEQNQTNIERDQDQEPNQKQDLNTVNTRKLYALSGLTAYLDNDTITSSGKLLDPNEFKMTSAMTALLFAATVASYMLPIPDPLSASLATVAVAKTLEAVYQMVRKQNFSKASELLGEAIGLGVSAGLVAFGVRFVTPVTLGIGISIAGLAACNYGYNSLQNLANNSVYTSSKRFYQAASVPFFIPAHIFKGGSYLIQKAAESVKKLSQRITNKPSSPTNSAEEQQPLINKQSSFHDDTHKQSIGITVLAVKILSGVLGGIRLPFQVAINMMKLSTTTNYEGTRKALCEVVHEHQKANKALCEVVHEHQKANSGVTKNSTWPTQATSFTGLNNLINGNRNEESPGLLKYVILQNKEKHPRNPSQKSNTPSTNQPEKSIMNIANLLVVKEENKQLNNP